MCTFSAKDFLFLCIPLLVLASNDELRRRQLSPIDLGSTLATTLSSDILRFNIGSTKIGTLFAMALMILKKQNKN